MAGYFNADEVFRMAEEIERNGAKFYRRAAERADDKMRQVFLDLAAMEDDHEQTFVQMRKDLVGSESKSAFPDMDNEGTLYLQAFADGKVFTTNPEQAFASSASVVDVLTIAISLEKDTIVFYQSLKSHLAGSAEAGKTDTEAGKIDALIDQEVGHIIELSKLLNSL